MGEGFCSLVLLAYRVPFTFTLPDTLLDEKQYFIGLWSDQKRPFLCFNELSLTSPIKGDMSPLKTNISSKESV